MKRCDGLRRFSPFQPICGTDSSDCGNRATSPGMMPRPSMPGDSSELANRSCSPRQMPKNGLPVPRYHLRSSVNPLAFSVSIALPKLPTLCIRTRHGTVSDKGK